MAEIILKVDYFFYFNSAINFLKEQKT